MVSVDRGRAPSSRRVLRRGGAPNPSARPPLPPPELARRGCDGRPPSIQPTLGLAPFPLLARRRREERSFCLCRSARIRNLNYAALPSSPKTSASPSSVESYSGCAFDERQSYYAACDRREFLAEFSRKVYINFKSETSVMPLQRPYFQLRRTVFRLQAGRRLLCHKFSSIPDRYRRETLSRCDSD